MRSVDGGDCDRSAHRSELPLAVAAAASHRDFRARDGDVRALERLIVRVQANDEVLGHARPDVVAALVSNIEAKLDAARRLQLARDRWALRAPVFAEYTAAMQGPLAQFAALNTALEDIKSLAGSPPPTLNFIDRAIARIAAAAAAVQPPTELVDAHALFVSAVGLAQNAAAIRREATMTENLQRAWDASSAAAGALMLGTGENGHSETAATATTAVITPRRTRLVRVPDLRARSVDDRAPDVGSLPGSVSLCRGRRADSRRRAPTWPAPVERDEGRYRDARRALRRPERAPRCPPTRADGVRPRSGSPFRSDGCH